MKKHYLALTLLASTLLIGTTLTSCGSETPEPDTTGPTSLVIGGPLSVKVGEKITLSADLVGSEDDAVNWESLDTTIATVDASGVVTGLEVGRVKIKATSKNFPSFSAEYEISVTAEYARGISIVVEETEDITFEDGVYNIPGGVTFRVNYKLDSTTATKPDSIAYSFAYANGDQATNFDCVIENQADGSALVTFHKTFTGGVITVTASYKASIDAAIRNAISVNSYDKNEANVTKLNEIISSLTEKEIGSLTSAKHVYKEGDSITEISEFRVYKDATYKTLTRVEGDQSKTTKSYSTLDEETSSFYLFSYDEDKKIEEMYANEEVPSTNLENYQNFVAQPNFMVDSVPTYGFTTLINTIATGGTYRSEYAFGDFLARGNAVYTFTDTSVKVETTYLDDVDYLNHALLELDYNSEFELTNFHYLYERGKDEESLTKIFEETGSDFVYGEKGNDITKEIDIQEYYIRDFEIEYVDGYEDIASDGTDGARYDIESETVDENGVKTFTLTYDRTLPLRITDFDPSTGSTLIDIASVTVSSEESGSRDAGIYRDGITVISAPKKEDGTFFKVEETVQIETRGGAVKTCKINWKEPVLNGINFDCPLDQEVNTSHKFNDIRIYKQTEYFWLNADPDDSIYDFDMKILSGDADGIELVPHDGDTDKEVPEGAYTIRANKVGTYTFHFYVIGHEDVHTETFTLNVLEGISAETYKTNLIGKTYEYNNGSTDFSLNFASETNMVLTMPKYVERAEGSEDVGDGEQVSVNIKYEIADGRVIVLTDGEDKVNQIFNSNDSYFDSIYGGDLEISEDFKTVELELRMRSDAGNDPTNYNYNVYTFILPSDMSSLAGKSFASGSIFVTGQAMSSVTLTFEDDSKGNFKLVNNVTKFEIASFTFDYVVNTNDPIFGTAVELSNVTLVNAGVSGTTFVSASMYDANNIDLRFKIPCQYGSFDYTFRVDLRNPL